MSLIKAPNNQVKCIIVDDDPFMQDLLKDKLSHFRHVHILAVASSAAEAIKLIQKHQPELVFLDVEMPDLTGFEMLEKLDFIDFKTIFVTSYSHYAIKAIRFNALDYILKPIDLQELRNAIRRFVNNRKRGDGENIKYALQNKNARTSGDKILTLKMQEGMIRFPLKQILYLEGDRNYSYIHTTDQKKTLVSKTLAVLEELVEDAGFFRCHKSYIVNRMHLTGELRRDSITITGGVKIPVSRRKVKMFKKWLAL